MSKIIALTGHKGSGKTSLARVISISHHYWIHPFAQPIKQMLGSLLTYQRVPQAIIREMVSGKLKETPTPYLSGRTPRYAMQTIGTEWRDMIGRDLWIDIWESAITDVSKVIVDDLRFPHEQERIHKLGGKIVRIVRPTTNPSSDSHQSETLLSDIPVDLELTNSSTIPNLMDELASHLDLI